jgi:hypothetical protein
MRANKDLASFTSRERDGAPGHPQVDCGRLAPADATSKTFAAAFKNQLVILRSPGAFCQPESRF